jgi:3-hydroxyisobutyrate dehydrogenase-like beta-hydroxyacid dehydrogenase
MATVGIVSPGAMGSAVGDALRRGGARVVATVVGRSERSARLAERAQLELLPDLTAVVRAADVVLSIVPPDQAEQIALELAGAALFADLNAVAPATAMRISPVVDGSISGPPPWQAGTTRIYLSGPRADEVAALAFEGVEVLLVGDEVGAASAVKMSTASVYKGSTALLAQALRAAQYYGVLDYVLGDLGDLADQAGGRIARAAAKSARYVGEMHEIKAAQEAAGLTPALFEAMAEVYSEMAGTKLARAAPEEAGSDLPEALHALGQRQLPERLDVRDADADQTERPRPVGQRAVEQGAGDLADRRAVVEPPRQSG